MRSGRVSKAGADGMRFVSVFAVSKGWISVREVCEYERQVGVSDMHWVAYLAAKVRELGCAAFG